MFPDGISAKRTGVAGGTGRGGIPPVPAVPGGGGSAGYGTGSTGAGTASAFFPAEHKNRGQNRPQRDDGDNEIIYRIHGILL